MEQLRPYWQMAILSSVSAAFVSAPLSACRAVGLIDWKLEDIPGAILLGQFLGEAPGWAGVLCYLFAGALLGIAYRFCFDSLKRTGWGVGMAIGIVQWLFIGLLVALAYRRLPDAPLLLPTEAPDEGLYGLGCFIFILLLNVFFGAWMGVVSTRRAEDLQEDISEKRSPSQPTRLQRAA